MAEEEDPFCSIFKHCKISSSQEFKLEHSLWAREWELYDFDDTPSAIDGNIPHEKEIFQTPPEHDNNRRSSSSSLEFLSQREKPVDAVIDVMEKTTCLDDGGVHLGGQRNLGCSETVALSEGNGVICARCSGNVNDIAGMVGSGTGLKRFRVSNKDELGKLSSKKIRVSQENWGWENWGWKDTHTQCVEERMAEQKSVGVVKDIGKKQQGAIRIEVEPQAKEFEKNVGFIKHVQMLQNLIPTLNCASRGVQDIREKEKISDERCLMPQKTYVEKSRDDVHQKAQKDANGACVQDIGGKAKMGDERCLMSQDIRGKAKMGDERYLMSQKTYVEKSRDDLHGKAQKDVIGACEGSNDPTKKRASEQRRELPLSLRGDVHRKAQKDVNGACEGSNDPTKKTASKQKGELPLSLGGKEDDKQGGDTGRKKSLGELMDTLEVMFKVDESEDVDFLVTAKRKGLNFPKPRWL